MPVRFQVDPDFYDHPKVLSMSDAAFALWTRAGSYCVAKHTDGFVADDVLSLFSETQRAAAPELVQRRLWRRIRGGYQFHQYGERNLTRARVEADREYDRERKQRQRKQARAANESTTNDHREAIDDPSKPRRENESGSTTAALGKPEPQAGSHDVPVGHPSDIRWDSERNPNRSVSVSVSESVSGSGHVVSAPPPRCPEHLTDPDPPPCGRCAEARRGRTTWEAEQAAYTVARDRKAPRCRTHPAELAHNCRSCAAELKGAA